MPGVIARSRVDQVGSLLRPKALIEASWQYEQGAIDQAALASVTDEAVRAVVAQQEAHQLPIVTDGEFRRFQFQDSFLSSVIGAEALQRSYHEWQIGEMAHAQPLTKGSSNVTRKGEAPTARLRLGRNWPLAEYAFAQRLTATPVKVTLLGPENVLRMFSAGDSSSPYGSSDDLLADVVAVSREMVGELVAAGCRYIHMDAPSYTAYINEAEAGADAAWVGRMEASIAADNAVAAGFPPEVTFGIHLCRGNRMSMWHREGAYDRIADALFNQLQYDRFLLEYDTERAGSFEPLRFMPSGKMAVLGLITTKHGEVEDVEALVRRVDEAARYIPLDQLAISPQCGFASVLMGNNLTEEAQWRKLDVMMETARRVWG